MKLIPLQGVDDLRFGESADKAIALFGEPEKERLQSYGGIEVRSLYWKHLSLGFDSSDRLNFVVASRDCAVELWGQYPFEIAQASDDEVATIRNWISKNGRQPIGHQDCFGFNLNVPNEAIVFCFEVGDRDTLDGIQLYAERFK